MSQAILKAGKNRATLKLYCVQLQIQKLTKNVPLGRIQVNNTILKAQGELCNVMSLMNTGMVRCLQ